MISWRNQELNLVVEVNAEAKGRAAGRVNNPARNQEAAELPPRQNESNEIAAPKMHGVWGGLKGKKMTKEERLKNIDEELQRIENFIENQKKPRPIMLSGDMPIGPLELLKMAVITRDSLEALKTLEVSIDNPVSINTLIKIWAGYELSKRIAIKTVGKKRVKRILKISKKYIDKKILDPIEKYVDSA